MICTRPVRYNTSYSNFYRKRGLVCVQIHTYVLARRVCQKAATYFLNVEVRSMVDILTYPPLDILLSPD
jgi:hypothetical protein